jgi:hypothetical protein
VGRKWAVFFYELEANHGLNPDLDSHLWLLHFLFLPMLNYDIDRWVEFWNSHPMLLPRGERNGATPAEQFFFYTLERGARGFGAIPRQEEGLPQLANEPNMGIQRGADGAPVHAIRPERLNQVNVEPPITDMVEAAVLELLRRLTEVVDLSATSMDMRTHVWIQGLQITEEMERENA